MCLMFMPRAVSAAIKYSVQGEGGGVIRKGRQAGRDQT